MKFPEHKCGLYLTHNEHKDAYDPIADWVAEMTEGENPFYSWISEEQKKKSLETNDVWTLQWYPDTPVGFYALAACDLESLLDYARSIDEKG